MQQKKNEKNISKNPEVLRKNKDKFDY